jgi:hypothetical protein
MIFMPVQRKYDKNNVVVVDPTLIMERMLHYRKGTTDGTSFAPYTGACTS